jgi:exo-beta-1,3-glucanase (GH17 family)
MDAAIARTRFSARSVREALAAHGLGDMPLVVGEMGWKSKTKYDASAPPEHAIEVQLAHPLNQKVFYDAVMAWVYGPARGPDSPDAAIYFEAFDEPWKDATGDDGWGLFDVERHAKYVIWDLFPERKPKDAPAYGAADAVHYRP